MLQDTVKTYHWLTQDYGHHKATDSLYAKLNTHVDRYIEIFINKFGRPSPEDLQRPLIMKVHMSKLEFFKYLYTVIQMLERGPLAVISSMDKGLSAVRDEIVASIRECLYLLHMQ